MPDVGAGVRRRHEELTTISTIPGSIETACNLLIAVRRSVVQVGCVDSWEVEA